MICKHDINVFVNRQLIYNYPEQLFADKGVMAIEHADFDGIERLALVTGKTTPFLFPYIHDSWQIHGITIAGKGDISPPTF